MTPWRLSARRAVATAAAVLVVGSGTVFACPVCFGAEETAMIDGSKFGVLVLLAITLLVQGRFAGSSSICAIAPGASPRPTSTMNGLSCKRPREHHD